MAPTLVARTESPAFFRELCPALELSAAATPPVDLRCSEADFAEQRRSLLNEGWMQLDGLLAPASLPPLVAGIEALVSADVPVIYAFVYDAFWGLVRDIAHLLTLRLGVRYGALPDFWVWHVPPSSQTGGWPRHRDFRKRVVREADSLPGRLNVWLALTDAPLDHACIHVVPLPSDPNYPHALERDDATESRALPVGAGTALAWDANVVHWGGPANPCAPSARISFAVTFERPGYEEQAVDFRRSFSFQDRLDVIAQQIVAYERYVPELPLELRDWARALVGLRRKFKGR